MANIHRETPTKLLQSGVCVYGVNQSRHRSQLGKGIQYLPVDMQVATIRQLYYDCASIHFVVYGMKWDLTMASKSTGIESYRFIPCYVWVGTSTENVLENGSHSQLVSLTSAEAVEMGRLEAEYALCQALDKCLVSCGEGYFCLPGPNGATYPASIELAPRMRLIFDGENAYAFYNMILIPKALRRGITSIYFSSNNTSDERCYFSSEETSTESYLQNVPFWENLGVLYEPEKPERPLLKYAIIYRPEIIKEIFPSLKCMAIATNEYGKIEKSPLYVGFCLLFDGLERLEIVFQSPSTDRFRRNKLWEDLGAINLCRYTADAGGQFDLVCPTYDGGPGALKLRNRTGHIDSVSLLLEKVGEEELDARGRHKRSACLQGGPEVVLEEFEVWAWKVVRLPVFPYLPLVSGRPPPALETQFLVQNEIVL
ncbi:hypothetical protein TWF106_003691 [Orbilia oligospora]|uniref:Uncharacterized protein n=1 Tax=Orbilia oligospora TaxID=2813651 RepID=A0A6G1LYY5_ORBOL|nr:hypothetical protein TWF106_003691 [Orbilia oligospora]KAF3218681.1 hypothetical protein TWF191_008126 [Orbilia oligospora]KAF3239229.1 hypothetical protein TWF192_010103 [Orbilia oligospora]